MNAVPLDHLDRRVRSQVGPTIDQPARIRELEALADALPLLIARDDERPRTWSLPSFTAQVADVRASLSGPTSVRTLAARLRPTGPEERVHGGRFELAARRLAHDAEALALAIRWLELETDTRLPSWPELLRRRPAIPGAGEPTNEAGLRIR